MKNLLLILAVVAALSACKKGENDPFISLKTRKGRLSGDWKVTHAVYSINDTVWTYNGTTLVKSMDGVELSSFPVTHEFSFTKSGEYTINKTNEYPANHFSPNTPAITTRYLETGIWNFTGGAGDTKTKSQLLMQAERIEKRVDGLSEVDAEAFVNPLYGKVINLDMLKNKEMRWKYDYTENKPTGKRTETGLWEFEKK
ncbi:MAG: hypothetical protein CL840_05740 [Crocinitomicaceae bacterium]|nr:hypothetical protein [Crocinitomicaceae bacterium]|tara:strand:+ start:293 stop:889 length:597 start_codon:yes stop_codon:yes gene_type:complete